MPISPYTGYESMPPMPEFLKRTNMSDAQETSSPENAAPAGPPLPASFEGMIEQYVKLRDRLKEADDAQKLKTAAAREYLQRLNGALLEKLQQSGGESIKTAAGTAYVTTKKSAGCEDAAEFQRHVIGTESWELADIKPNSKAVEDYANEHGQLPPGVKFTMMHVVGVRRA